MAVNTGYPATLEIDYPEKSNRLTVAFRIFTVLPILLVLILLSSGTEASAGVASFGASALFVPTLLLILFRRKYPRWWFDWNLELTRFSTRVAAYLFLLQDDYPSTDEQQGVHLNITYPDAATDLKRGLPLIKWLLALPHIIVLIFLSVFAILATFYAWFAILITGSYPRGVFNFVVGVLRWHLRVSTYAFLLTTDQYPPFSTS